MRRRALVALLLILALPVSARGQDSDDEFCFAGAIATERARSNVPVLMREARLDSIARDHSKEMAARGTIYHNPNVGSEIGSYSYAGENVGMGPDCDAIHQAFMASTGHRENILDADYRKLGVGVAHDKEGTVYVTEVFMTPRSAPTTAPPRATPRATPPRCT